MFVVVGVLFRNGLVWLVVLLVVRRVAGGVRVVALDVSPFAAQAALASGSRLFAGVLWPVRWLRLLLAVWRRLPSSTGVRSRPERFDLATTCLMATDETCGASAATKFRPYANRRSIPHRLCCVCSCLL